MEKKKRDAAQARQLFLFEGFEGEGEKAGGKKGAKEAFRPLFFAAPKNDNERLLNFQAESFSAKDEKERQRAEERIYLLARDVAERIVVKIGAKNPVVARFGKEDVRAAAHDAVCEMFFSRLNNRSLVVANFVSYLYLSVKHVLFPRKKAAEKLVAFSFGDLSEIEAFLPLR